MFAMKKIFLVILAFVCFSLRIYGQQVQKKEVYTFASPIMLEKICKSKSIKFSILEFNKYKLELNGYFVIATIEDGDLMFSTYFKDSPSLNRINDFNRRFRWVRLSLDTEGDLVVEQELSFSGGISVGCIHVFINTYGILLDKVSSEMQ
jgi:hypothetical protein